jgi:hypothetical protein
MINRTEVKSQQVLGIACQVLWAPHHYSLQPYGEAICAELVSRRLDLTRELAASERTLRN